MNDRIKKAIKIIGTVLYIALIAAALIAVGFTVSLKKSGRSPGMLRVLTGSMEGERSFYEDKNFKIGRIETDCLVFLEKNNNDLEFAAKLKAGDVITFEYFHPAAPAAKKLVTHRIVSIEPRIYEGNVLDYAITTRGDANDASVVENISVKENLILGRVKTTSLALGKTVALLQSRAGIICVIIVPGAILIVIEIIRIINMVNKSKLAKAAEKAKEGYSCEVEELKRKLEELTKASAEEQRAGGDEQFDRDIKGKTSDETKYSDPSAVITNNDGMWDACYDDDKGEINEE